jgi:zinc transporter 1/2/3
MLLQLAEQISSTMLWRTLMGAGHAHGPFEEESAHDHDHEEHEHGAHESEYTLDLRIAAIFVVFAAALIMGLPPIYAKHFQNPDALFARLLRAFAGGTILSLALVHIIPSAIFQLAGLTQYSFGGVAVLAGIFILMAIDSALQAAWAPKSATGHHSSRSSHDACHRSASAQSHGQHGQSRNPGSDDSPAGRTGDIKVILQEDGRSGSLRGPTHTHHCLRGLSQEQWVASADMSSSQSLKQCVTAYTLELGCIFHSVIIGIGLGVMTGDRGMVITMMVALSIHQGLEGLSVGSVLGVTDFTRLKKTIMLLMYCITTPIGIAIGIALSASYDPASITSRAVEGAINGISGGMLLYISLLQLIAEEFTRQDILAQPGRLALMHLALLLGLGSMCVIAIWA